MMKDDRVVIENNMDRKLAAMECDNGDVNHLHYSIDTRSPAVKESFVRIDHDWYLHIDHSNHVVVEVKLLVRRKSFEEVRAVQDKQTRFLWKLAFEWMSIEVGLHYRNFVFERIRAWCLHFAWIFLRIEFLR